MWYFKVNVAGTRYAFLTSSAPGRPVVAVTWCSVTQQIVSSETFGVKKVSIASVGTKLSLALVCRSPAGRSGRYRFVDLAVGQDRDPSSLTCHAGRRRRPRRGQTGRQPRRGQQNGNNAHVGLLGGTPAACCSASSRRRSRCCTGRTAGSLTGRKFGNPVNSPMPSNAFDADQGGHWTAGPANGLGQQGFEFMEAVLSRAGLWFGAMVLAVVAAAYAHDSGFAAQMMILAVVALAGLWISVARADVARARPARILRMPTDPSKYDDDPVRWGVIATVFWGDGRHCSRRCSSRCSWPSRRSTSSRIHQFRPAAAAAHLGGDLRFRRQRPDRDQLLRRPAHLPRAAGLPRPRPLRVLGLPAVHRAGRDRLSARHHRGQANMPSPNGTSTCG